MLTIVPTPIGNLRDMSLRGADALREADWIAAEDTRHTARLLQSLELSKPMISFHDHNEASRTVELVERLQKGENGALVSDAGMPLVSDPGYRLVRACVEQGIPLTVLPGPSAVPTALAGSGLPPHPFYFGGFLPVKSGRREKELRLALDRGHTSIYFESPHRLLKTLDCLSGISQECRVCVARELTKKFEEFRRGTAREVAAYYREHPPKGEITFLLHPGEKNSHSPEKYSFSATDTGLDDMDS